MKHSNCAMYTLHRLFSYNNSVMSSSFRKFFGSNCTFSSELGGVLNKSPLPPRWPTYSGTPPGAKI